MTKTLQVRMSDEDYASLVERAGGTGKRLSEYCRLVLLRKEDEEPSKSPAFASIEAKLPKRAARQPGAMCHRCTTIGHPCCGPCIEASRKLAPSSTEVFSHLL